MVKAFQVTYQKGGYKVNCYFVTCPKTKKTALIDLGGGVDVVFKYLQDNKLDLQYILCTHLHDDHCAEVETFQNKLTKPVPVYNHPIMKDLPKLGELEIKVFHTPAHSDTDNCYYVGDILFAGDALDIHCGKRMVAKTLSYLSVRNLPDDTKVYRGHEPPTTLGEIKKEIK